MSTSPTPKHSLLDFSSIVRFFTFAIIFTSTTPAISQSAKFAAQKGFPSLVMLMMEDNNGQPQALGSGFIVKPGVIATNMHVVSGSVRGWAKLVGKSERHPIESVVAIDEENDLVLLAVPGVAKAPIMRLADSSKAAVGDEIFALGNPLGLEGTVSSGIISGLRTSEKISLIQVTAPISPGSSGGPVVDTKGDVIGVAVSTFRGGQNLNFAIPSQRVGVLLQQTPIKPKALHNLSPKSTKTSSIKTIGDKAISGVVAAHADCFKPDTSNPFMDWDCSFSIQNKLQSPVSSIRAIFILWGRDGTAIDVHETLLPGPIRPGLASRSEKFKVETNIKRIATRMEARILDFRILE